MSEKQVMAPPPVDQLIPRFDLAKEQVPNGPQRWEALRYDRDQTSLKYRGCLVIPVQMEILTEPRVISYWQAAMRFSLNTVLWEGTSAKSGLLLPDGKTEVRRVDAIASRHLVYLRDADPTQSLKKENIPPSLASFPIREWEGGFLLENVPPTVLQDLRARVEHLARGGVRFMVVPDQQTEREYPGGNQGFRNAIEGPLVDYGMQLTELFGPPLVRNVNVQWKPMQGRPAVAFTDFTTVRTPDEGTLLAVLSSGSHSVDIHTKKSPTEPWSSAEMDAGIREEIGRVATMEAVPHLYMLQQAAPLFLERELRGAHPPAPDAIHPSDFASLDVLAGDLGLEVPLGSRIHISGTEEQECNQVRHMLGTLALQELLTIAGSRESFLRILQEGKKFACQKVYNGPMVKLPTPEEWLQVASKVTKGFAEKYQQSAFAQPMLPGRRVVSGNRNNGRGITLFAYDIRENENFAEQRLAKHFTAPTDYCFASAADTAIFIDFQYPGLPPRRIPFLGVCHITPELIFESLQIVSPGAYATGDVQVKIDIPDAPESNLTLTWTPPTMRTPAQPS